MKGFLGHHKKRVNSWIYGNRRIIDSLICLVLIMKGESEEALIRLSSVIEKTYVTEVPRNDLFY